MDGWIATSVFAFLSVVFFGSMPVSLVGSAFKKKLTILSGLLNECINAAFSVVSLRSHSGHIVPAHGFHNVHHGLGLVCVWGHHSGEEVIAGVITQLWSRGGVAHLGNL